MAVVRQRDNLQISEKEELIREIKNILPSQYHDFSELQLAGSRGVVAVTWGPGNEKRWVKVDRLVGNVENPRTLRALTRGYTTENDIKILANAPDKDKHGMVDLVDYYKLSDGRFISVERAFGNRTLDDRLKESPLSEEEFVNVYRRTTEALRYAHSELGLFHRDLSNHNTLVDEIKGTVVDARITDWATAGDKSSVTPKSIPTSGRHWFTDPLLVEAFTGKQREYSIGSDMYSIGVGMLSSLTGNYAFEYDPDAEFAVDCETGESLLDENGKISIEKHQTVVNKSLSKLPKHLRKRYGKIISKLLTLEESKRYQSIEDLIEDFNWASSGGLLGKLKRARGKIATGITGGLLALGIAGGFAHHEMQLKDAQHQAELRESEKYVVTTDWDGNSLEVSNNLIETEVTVYGKNEEKEFAVLYSGESKESFIHTNHIKVKPGDKLDINFSAKEIPWKGRNKDGSLNFPSFGIEAYVEGYEPVRSSVYPIMHNTANMSWEGMGANIGATNFSFQIPELKEGCYYINIELFPEEVSEDFKTSYKDYQTKVKFENGGELISRQRIPIVIGNPKIKPTIQTVTFEKWGYGNRAELKEMNEGYSLYSNRIQYELDLFKREGETYEFVEHTETQKSEENPYHKPFLKDPEQAGEYVAVLSAGHYGEARIFRTFIPLRTIQPYLTYPADFPRKEELKWDFSTYGPDFSQKLIRIKKDLERKNKSSK